jgi:hypothetical protein
VKKESAEQVQPLVGLTARDEEARYLRGLASDTGYPPYVLGAVALRLGVEAMRAQAGTPGFLEQHVAARVRARRPRRRLT